MFDEPLVEHNAAFLHPRQSGTAMTLADRDSGKFGPPIQSSARSRTRRCAKQGAVLPLLANRAGRSFRIGGCRRARVLGRQPSRGPRFLRSAREARRVRGGEASRPEIDGADRQLFEYAFHEGVPMAVLTDGQELEFLSPCGARSLRGPPGLPPRPCRRDVDERDAGPLLSLLRNAVRSRKRSRTPGATTVTYTAAARSTRRCPRLGAS